MSDIYKKDTPLQLLRMSLSLMLVLVIILVIAAGSCSLPTSSSLLGFM